MNDSAYERRMRSLYEQHVDDLRERVFTLEQKIAWATFRSRLLLVLMVVFVIVYAIVSTLRT